MSLWSFGRVRAAGLHEPDAALDAVEEAVVIYRRLAKALSLVFTRYLRSAISTQADVLHGLGRSDEADELRQLNEDHPI